MEPYLEGNLRYWQPGYGDENVESFVFRPYGRILKAELGLDGSHGERLLDFGCGTGAAAGFFHAKGFDVYGIDLSAASIERCRARLPQIADHFAVIEPKPHADDRFFGGGFDAVVAIQSLYYLSASDLETRLESLLQQLRPGGVILASMMGTRCWFYDHSTDAGDGLRRVEISTARVQVRDYFVNFTASEDELRSKFAMFEPLHVGYYDARYREDEGSDFHYLFVGRKPNGGAPVSRAWSAASRTVASRS